MIAVLSCVAVERLQLEADAERLEIRSMDLRVPFRLTRMCSSYIATSVRCCFGLRHFTLLYFISTLRYFRLVFEAFSNGVLSLPFSLLKSLDLM